MPQYKAIEEYLGVITKLCGEGDQLLLFLISMAVVHCVQQNNQSKESIRIVASAG